MRARVPYPEGLVSTIVDLNGLWLHDHPFSFRNQIAKAVGRGDKVSVNHRLAAWLASYFDIVFALNHVLHPGEKRMLEVAQRECKNVPEGMPEDVETALSQADPVATLDGMWERLAGALGPHYGSEHAVGH